jgi:hypothetical protein
VGNIKDAAIQNLDREQNQKQIYDEHRDKPYEGLFSFHQPSLLVNNVDFLKGIPVKYAQNFISLVQSADEKTDPQTAKAMFELKGKKWKHVRLGMTAIFTPRKVKNMFT